MDSVPEGLALAITVARHNPTPPRRMSGSDTVFIPRLLPTMPASALRMASTGSVRSRFMSSALMDKSR